MKTTEGDEMGKHGPLVISTVNGDQRSGNQSESQERRVYHQPVKKNESERRMRQDRTDHRELAVVFSKSEA